MASIVVTGRGVVSSLGNGADLFFDSLLKLRSGVSDEGIAPCAEFDPESSMTPKEVRRNDRFTQLAVAATDEAAAEAGLMGEVDPARVGVIIGTGVGGL